MADEPGEERPDYTEEEEGGPVKSFLEHLEDLRWVLIKSLVCLALGMLICLIAGNKVVAILKRPMDKATVSYPGTNQVVSAYLGTNHLGTFTLTPEQQTSLELDTNRFVAVQIEPLRLGTNFVLSWKVSNDPELRNWPQHLKVDLLNLGPAGAFFVGVQVAFYGG